MFEIDSSATLRWNLFGFPDVYIIYRIAYYKNNKREILLSTIRNIKVNQALNYNPNNNPFERKRISGNLHLNNGNGTLTIILSNVQYNESGVFSLEIISLAARYGEVNNITLDVQSKNFYMLFYKNAKIKIRDFQAELFSRHCYHTNSFWLQPQKLFVLGNLNIILTIFLNI